VHEAAKHEQCPTQKTYGQAAETVVEVAVHHHGAALEAVELLANNHPNPNVQTRRHLALLLV
jgi:hypothetical protein